jgi:hypothetical protein
MSAGENVWPLVAELATVLDGNRESAERRLDQYEKELHSVPGGARDEIRRQMIQVVAALSRLEIRLIDSYGPLPISV